MKDYYFREYNEIASGLQILLDSTRIYADSIPQKLQAMQEIHLQRNQGRYSERNIKQLRYYLKAYSYKFYLATMHLEQLWGLTHTDPDDKNLLEILQNIFDDHQILNDNLLLCSFVLEGFLLQGTAFFDFYLLHICSIFQIDKLNRMSERKLLGSLSNICHPDLYRKALHIKSQYELEEPKKRRKLLRDLRNAAIHRDESHPSFDTQKTLLEKVLLNWSAELQATSCARFCQDMQNDMFSLVTNIGSVLFDLEWKPGPFRPGLWG